MMMKTIFNIITVLIVVYAVLSCNQEETVGDNKNVINKEDQIKDTLIDYKIIKATPFLDFHPNGKLKIKGQFKNGFRDSLWVSYYPNGIIQSKNYYKDSVLNGNSIVYYSDGSIRYAGFYLQGKKHGKWEFIDKEGNKREIWFNHGNKK